MSPWWIALGAWFAASLVLTIVFVKSLAPSTPEERKIADDAQMEALAKRRKPE